MKILHTGDWHIGNYNGPEVNGENARFLDLCKCLDALLAQAIEEHPDFIIVAGDIFHQARVWSDRGLKESQTVIRYIRQLEIVAPVIIVRGTPNHDSEQQYRSLMTAFVGDDSVHIFMEPGVLKVYGYHHGTAINVAALPGFDRGMFRAKNPGLDKEEETEVFTEALKDIIIGLKAQCDTDAPSVLVGHYTITGANMESGQTALFAQYEPVVEPSTLAAADFDLVCFGHIHRPQSIEGCNATYYCGAISQLNFNDEGQPRGYYTHELERGVRVSTFHPLPTREFLTIRLDDEAIRQINETGPEWMAGLGPIGVKGKIIRVLYNCTDENNKALNKTMLEDYLYKCGAFWVQEITPEKITITVSKGSLNDDDLPETNLRAYLEEKGIAQADIGRIIERARPIIAEAEAGKMAARSTGAFVPAEIEVHNYRNYRDETFSFEPIKFCTINGVNGAGKSSLFMDAMCDALFEETREGDIAGWISNDPEARSGSIKFTFHMGDALFRVTRTRMKSGKATLNLAEMVDGEWVDRSSEKMRDTQAAILNTIGMDSMTLKATALIMQDQYGLFLMADKEARMTILGNILGLGSYGDMETLAAARLTDTNREIRQTQDLAADLQRTLRDPEQIMHSMSECQEAIKAEGEIITAKTAEQRELEAKLAGMDEAVSRVVKLDGQISAYRSKKAAIESQITTQRAIIDAAENALDRREAILQAVEEQRALREEEKKLVSARASYDHIYKRLNELKAKLKDTEENTGKLRQLLRSVQEARIEPAKAILAQADALEEAHRDYLATVAAISAEQELKEAFMAAMKTLGAAEDNLRLVKTERAASVREAETHLGNLKRRAQLFQENNCPHAEEVRCAFLRDALEAQDALPAAETDVQQAKDYERIALAEAEKALAEARAQVPEYSLKTMETLTAHLEALRDQERMYGDLAITKAGLEAAEERAADLSAQIDAQEKSAADLEWQIDECDTELQSLREDVARSVEVEERLKAVSTLADEEKELPAAQERWTTATKRVIELMQEADAITAEVEALAMERDTEAEKTNGRLRFETLLKIIKNEIRSAEERQDCRQQKYGGFAQALEQTKEQQRKIEELMQRAAELGEVAADLDLLKQAFSQDGIPHNIVRSIVPIFEATATNILGQMSGGHMSVEFVMEKTLKSNSKKEVTALDIVINDSATGRLPYMSRSGGERVKAALAVILALAEIKSTKAGVQLGFLFIDEPPFLDAQGVTAYCDALEAIQRRYTDLKVMAITHDPEMKSRFPQSVDIVKTPEGSKVIYA